MKKRKIIRIALVLGGILLILLVLLLLAFGGAQLLSFLFIGSGSFRTETQDISDYGVYTGNHNDRFATEFITSFFPEAIGDEFQDVQYIYRAQRIDAYSFEAYLEFTIEDPAAFDQHLNSVVGSGQTNNFSFDSDFQEYRIQDRLHLESLQDDGSYTICCAEIGKVLFNPNEQRVIYVALGVFDGGGVDTNYLSAFFTRFNIEPKKYEMYTQSLNLEDATVDAEIE